VAGRNFPHKGHKGAPQAGLASFWSLIPDCWRISPAPESHSQEGRNRGCKSQTPCGPRAEAGIWEYPPEGGKGLLSHGSLVTRSELAAWRRSHKDQLGRARAGGSGWASIWNHLAPGASAKPWGLCCFSIPRAVSMGRQVQESQGERTWL